MSEGSMGAEYFSKDFDWEELKREIESDPSFRYHLLPFEPSATPTSVVLQAEEESNAWREFHARHYTGKFFKERRYLLKEFPELLSCEKDSKILEVGCGNGSTVLPILRILLQDSDLKDTPSGVTTLVLPLAPSVNKEKTSFVTSIAKVMENNPAEIIRNGNANVIVYACDCSNEALQYAKEIVDATNVLSIKERFHPFQCDFSVCGFPMWLACTPCRETLLCYSCSSDANETVGSIANELPLSKESSCCLGGVNFVTLIFTLSAVPFQKMLSAVKECFSVLKPGGLILFRDYGLFDMTMLRFESDKRVGFREYMRADGTLSYFFSMETTRELFLQAGFIEIELEYCCIKSLNRKKDKTMRRVWVHGKFQKPW